MEQLFAAYKHLPLHPLLLSSQASGPSQVLLKKFFEQEYQFCFEAQSQKQIYDRQFTRILDKNSAILWAVRGGYGAMRIFSFYSPSELKDFFYNRLLIGFSDLTAIHALYAHYGQMSLHGPMLAELIDTELEKRDSFGTNKSILTSSPRLSPKNLEQCFSFIEKIYTKETKSFCSEGWRVLNDENSLDLTPLLQMNPCGKMTGGNLTLLQSLIGTPHQAFCQYEYLFIEDVHIKPYQIDRILWHLYQAGCLHHFKAIFCGSFSLPFEKIKDIFNAWSSRLKIPFFTHEHYGHGPCNDFLAFHTPVFLTQGSLGEMRLNFKLFD